jgi:hypothetical protein
MLACMWDRSANNKRDGARRGPGEDADEKSDFVTSMSAICTIFYALFRVVTLTKKIPGGLVKRYWRLFYYLIGLLAVGYLTVPLFPRLPENSRELIVSIIFLAGAVFVLKVIGLFFKIVQEIGL